MLLLKRNQQTWASHNNRFNDYDTLMIDADFLITKSNIHKSVCLCVANKISWKFPFELDNQDGWPVWI